MSSSPLPSGVSPVRAEAPSAAEVGEAPCGPGRWTWTFVLGGLLAAGLFLGIAILGLGWRGPGGFPPYVPFFPFGLLIGWLAVFLLLRVALGSRWGWGYRGGGWHVEDPRTILAWRYARGEISREQLREMRAELDRGP